MFNLEAIKNKTAYYDIYKCRPVAKDIKQIKKILINSQKNTDWLITKDKTRWNNYRYIGQKFNRFKGKDHGVRHIEHEKGAFSDTWYVGCNNGSFGHVTISDNGVMCTSGVGDTRPKCKNIREWTIQDAANYMCQ